ncbi:hypothetical protein L1987_61197 [Smallanthus sonchifolius]|uniref:Uncharacterized protein n=1 Tax=Smallanthus sonchifolius TaxID=185202 RepID=A0ACB9DB10_9ASTR|nr:hypothetical protein L1987_61197 [Smallanthus sonchifolius]
MRSCSLLLQDFGVLIRHRSCFRRPLTQVRHSQGMLFMVEEAILGFVDKNVEIKDYGEFALEKGISQEGIVNVIKSLDGLRFVNGMELLLDVLEGFLKFEYDAGLYKFCKVPCFSYFD